MQHMGTTGLGAAITLCAAASAASAQCTPEWLPGQPVLGVNGEVIAATTWDPDGPGPLQDVLVVGGEFTVAGAALASRIAAWDGSAWQSLGTGISGSVGIGSNVVRVNALTTYDGLLIAAGSFTTAGGVAASAIAAWDGVSWQPLGSGVSTPGPGAVYSVSALTVSGNDLIVGGAFTTAGGQPAVGIARWDGSAWHPLGPGEFYGVNALGVYQGELVAAGEYYAPGGLPVQHLVRWDGSSWTALGAGANGQVLALAEFNNELIAAGSFTTAGGVSANRIARWNAASWQPLGTGISGPSCCPSVHTLTVYNGELIAGGNFPTAGGVAANAIARWNGLGWAPLASGVGLATYPTVNALAVYDGALVAAGIFAGAGGIVAGNIARWTGADWHPVGSGSNLSESPFALAEYQSDLIAGGWFFAAGNQVVNGIARWDGSAWQPLAEGVGGGSPPFVSAVSALAVYNNGLVAGGSFDTAGGQPASKIARWDGLAWHPLGEGLGGSFNWWVSALTVHNDDLIAGGHFTHAGGQPASCVARWDGLAWHPLGVGITGGTGGGGFTQPPKVLALAAYDGDLIAGGAFTAAGGVALNHVGRWNGSTWQPLGTANLLEVQALAVFNGDLIAGGTFTAAGLNHVARWDGSSWHPLGTGLSGWPNFPYSGPVYDLTVFRGALIAGGSFHMAGAQVANGIARWDGAAWNAMGTGIGPFSGVAALTVHGGELIAGGGFHTAGGQFSPHWAHWGCACYPDCTADGQLTVADFGCFQTKFVIGDPYADCNGLGGLTIADFGCFQTKFVAGCP